MKYFRQTSTSSAIKGASIKGDLEKSLEWYWQPNRTECAKTKTRPNKAVLIRTRNIGRFGIDIVPLSVDTFLVYKIDGEGQFLSHSKIVEAKNLNEVVLFLYNNTIMCDHIIYDWAFSPLTPLQVEVREMIIASKSVEDVGLAIIPPPISGKHVGIAYVGLKEDVEVLEYTPNPREGAIPLTKEMSDDYIKTASLALYKEMQEAIQKGGETIVISCKGLARTKVPFGTLVSRNGTFSHFILPDGTKMGHHRYGWGTDQYIVYEKVGNVNIESINLLAYKVVS